jgi:hypothetical protein
MVLLLGVLAVMELLTLMFGERLLAAVNYQVGFTTLVVEVVVLLLAHQEEQVALVVVELEAQIIQELLAL